MNKKQNKPMKKAILLGVAFAAINTTVNAQWQGAPCNRPQNVTVIRNNYYQPNNGWGGGCGGNQWGYNGFGQPIPNGLGWTLFGIGTFMNLFAPRPVPTAQYVQYPVYQSPAPVVVER
jgi:hypothetical protein